MTCIARLLPEALKSPPTLDGVINLVGSVQFNEVMSAARYLKEYAAGLEIAERVIDFVEASPALNNENPEHRAALIKLWRSKLRLLDRADRWDDYVNVVLALERRVDLVAPTPPQSIHESDYNYYKRMLSQQSLDRQRRAVYNELASRTESCQDRTYHRDGTWTANVPATLKHMLDDLFLKDRLRIIQGKIAKRNEGKRITHLQHKQAWELTDEEYKRRQEWLRTWRAYRRRCKESIRRAAGTSHISGRAGAGGAEPCDPKIDQGSGARNDARRCPHRKCPRARRRPRGVWLCSPCASRPGSRYLRRWLSASKAVNGRR